MAKAQDGGESVSGYFRTVFKDRPDWLHETSNDVILARYRADHNLAADATIDKRIKQNLSNIKSVLRKEGRNQAKRGPGRPRKDQSAAAAAAPTAVITVRRLNPSRLETLEEQIDDCLTMAKHLDRDALHEVIQQLRRARNAVVWQLGQP